MARTAPAVLAAWAVLSAACAGGEPAGAGDAAPAPPPFRSALIGEPAPPSPPFLLTLKTPGSEPRRALRYRVAPAAHERARISINSEIEVFIAGRRVERIAPPTTDMTFEVDVAPHPGGYRCAAWITDTATADWERMAPGRGSEVRSSLEKLRGHHISFEVDVRGHPVSQDISLPESLDANRSVALQFLQGVDGAVVPFPAEPVGVGAIWSVVDAESTRSDLAGDVMMTYTLVGMRGDRLDLSMQLGLPPEPAPLSIAGGRVSGYSGAATSGAVRTAVDLTHILSDSEGAFVVDLEGRTFSGTEELPFRIHQKLQHKVDSR